MDQRIEQALTYLIEDFIRTAEPISSQGIVRNHGLDVSSATIRNWFGTLEEGGFLIQPHTSSGRIPSEKAYRWYIEHLKEVDASSEDKRLLDSAKKGEDADPSSGIKQLAKACAEMTGTAVLLGMKESDTYYTGLTQLFSHPEFKDWSRVISMGSMLDQLDHQLNQLRKKVFAEPMIEIGESCPFGNACGSILLTGKDESLFILLGPIRMDYKRALQVMSYMKEIL